jgi:chemotaxis protein methyltransferase CheR
MNGPDVDHFCQLIRLRSGLVLTPDKGYLISSRLAAIARSEGLAGVPDLLAKLRAGAGEALIVRCVEAMATHESFFFRDGSPFEQLGQQVLPELIATRAHVRTLRIWCAACSSGQEPYSIAMLLQEMSHLTPGWRLEIVATDMSEAILQKARSGIFSDFEVRRGLSEARLQRWFAKDGHNWRISPTLQQMISFRTHNLLHGTNGLGSFDVIFCRNVLIYFDVAQKRSILEGLAGAMAQDGGLFLGSAETVIGITDAFELTPGARGLYRKPQGARLARTG